jgi:phage terminase large subunit
VKEERIKVNDAVYDWLDSNRAFRFLYAYGGAGAGKSWTIGQYLVIEKAINEPGVGILALRKTRPTVRVSCLKVVKGTLDALGIDYDFNKSELTLTLANKSFFQFDGLDEVAKKKSIEGINYIWLEEATDFTEKEFLRLNLTARAKNKNGINQMFCSFNPVNPIQNAWLKTRVDMAATSKDSRALKVVHTDNPFLSDDERQQIENLALLDAEYDEIYRKGEWATPTGIIFTNWDVVDCIPDGCLIGHGLDFGFNNPAALIAVHEKENEVWLDELIYETKLTNADLMERFPAVGVKNTDEIIGDCAEPKAIEEIGRGGWNIHPCMKGTDSVLHGIRAMKQKKMHVTRRSANLIGELGSYKWRVNRAGEVLDEPVPFNNHGIDATRYRLTKPQAVTPSFQYVGEFEF